MAFVVQPIPQREETLNSLLVRLAESNGLQNIGDVIATVNIHRNNNTYNLAFPLWNEANRLAKLLGTSKAEVAARLHPEIDVGSSADLVSYHGLPLRRVFLISRHRRFSPASLKLSPYHRSRWDVKLLPFCPESFELLHSSCPGCGESAVWRAPLCACHRCGCDYREAVSETIAECDRGVASWAANLVSVDPAIRDVAWSEIDPSLTALGQVAVLDLLGIFGALSEDPSERSSRKLLRGLRSGDFRQWTAAMLFAGANIMRDWPNGFFRLVAKLIEAAPERNSGYGRAYLLGFLAQLADPKLQNRPFADYFRPLIEEAIARAQNEELRTKPADLEASIITPEEIEKRYRISRPTIDRWSKTLGMFAGRELGRGRRVGFNREQFEKLMNLRESALPNVETCSEIGKRTRFPIPALVYLSGKGLLPHAGEELRILRGVALPVFYRNSVETAFAEKIAGYRGNLDNRVSLGTALNFAGFFADGWIQALEAILSDRLPADLTEDQSIRFAYRIGVDQLALDSVLEGAAGAVPERVPIALAASILKVEYSTLADAVTEGLMESADVSECTSMRAIAKFRREFVTCGHLCSEFDVSLKAVWRTLDKASIKPVLEPRAERQLIYRRESSSEALRSAIQHPPRRPWKKHSARLMKVV